MDDTGLINCIDNDKTALETLLTKEIPDQQNFFAIILFLVVFLSKIDLLEKTLSVFPLKGRYRSYCYGHRIVPLFTKYVFELLLSINISNTDNINRQKAQVKTK